MDWNSYASDELARHTLTDPDATERERILAQRLEAAPDADAFQEATERRDELEEENEEQGKKIDALEKERDDFEADVRDLEKRLSQHEEV